MRAKARRSPPGLRVPLPFRSPLVAPPLRRESRGNLRTNGSMSMRVRAAGPDRAVRVCLCRCACSCVAIAKPLARVAGRNVAILQLTAALVDRAKRAAPLEAECAATILPACPPACQRRSQGVGLVRVTLGFVGAQSIEGTDGIDSLRAIPSASVVGPSVFRPAACLFVCLFVCLLTCSIVRGSINWSVSIERR